MSYITDYAENKLADFVRAQGLTLPVTWYVALLSGTPTDSSLTELSGTSYLRQGITRSLSAMAGTQGGGTTLASTGTSHATSNNSAVNFGTAGSAWGTATHVGIFDTASGGNMWFYLPLVAPITINSGDPVSLPAGSLYMTLGLVGGMSDYLANKMIDLIFRGQAYTWPATLYCSLFSAAPTNAGGGTEFSAGNYARVALVPSLTSLCGTQGAGTTVASTGSTGRTANNAAITFASPNADWGTVNGQGIHDAITAGNLLFWGTPSVPKTVSSGGAAPSYDADTLSITFA